jgi:hypothetical protein
LDHGAHRRNVDALLRRWRDVHPRLDPLANGLAKIVRNLCRRRVGVLWPWTRKEPMDIGMRAGQRIPAVLAGTARKWCYAGAQQALPEPQGKALLADAGRTVKEQ